MIRCLEVIYLDHSATTPVCHAARRAVLEAFDSFGNPSSLHSEGLKAQKLLDESRKALFGALNIRNTQAYRVIFTSCGSEANNQIIFSAAASRLSRRTDGAPYRIVTTDSEHPSVEMALKELEKNGADVVRLSTVKGVVDQNELENAVDERTVLVTIMGVNNETGAVYDTRALFAAAKRKNPGVVTHSDCVQAFMKIPFSMPASSADAVTLSAHKIGAPKGCGALVVTEKLSRAFLRPFIHGGGQEGGLRSGTENVPGIAAFGAAAAERFSSASKEALHALSLREALLSALPSEIRVNSPENVCPGIVSLTLPDIKSETMLHFLSSKGVFVSSGSACSSNGHKNRAEKSRVLLNFGLTEREADCTIRLSTGPDNTEEEMLFTAEALKEGLSTLVRIR